MELGQVASRSFVLLRAEWQCGRALRALKTRTASHAIVHRRIDLGTEYWYLYRLADAQAALAAAPTAATVGAALALREGFAVPSRDAHDSAEASPRAVVMADGLLAGFVDRSVPAASAPGAGAPPQVFRGGLRGGRAEPPAAAPARSLEAEFPESVAVGSEEWLLVHVAASAATSRGMALSLPSGEQLDVIVQPRKGFTLIGTDHGTLIVPQEGDSLPLQFKLRAVDPGKGLIRVIAFHGGQPLGTIEFAPAVEAATASAVRGGVAAAHARQTKPIESPGAQGPDLVMFIEQREAGGTVEYLIRLTASDPALDLNYSPFGPFKLSLDPAKFFADFFQEIEGLALETPAQQDVAERRLAAKGSYLWEQLFPEPLRQKLWDIRDRIKSVIVQSEEPWIPWELCKLSGRDGGRVVEGPFLSEAYAITRWLPGIGLKPPINIRNIALVVPPDSGLALAVEERNYVLSLAGPQRKVTAISPTFQDVQDAFTAGSYDAWHFSGHGIAQDANPDRSAIILGGDEQFTPEDLSGQATNMGIPRPLVFINACQVGRSGMALTGIGGWARRFVGAGAAVFIGAYWSVYDEPAFAFAKAVYEQLLAGKPIGEAVRAARAAIRGKGDPTWLAYTVFAHPLATVA